MALKDWKKEPKRYEWYKYTEKHKGKIIDIVANYAAFGKDNFEVRQFVFVNGIGRHQYKENKFNNMVKALKFAKSYMRTH